MRGCVVHEGAPAIGCPDCARLARRVQDWRDEEIKRLRAEVARLQGQLDSHGVLWCQPVLREPSIADVVGQALVIATLPPGEEPINPYDHALIHAIQRLRRRRERKNRAPYKPGKLPPSAL